jgi:hypothetical protein
MIQNRVTVHGFINFYVLKYVYSSVTKMYEQPGAINVLN